MDNMDGPKFISTNGSIVNASNSTTSSNSSTSKTITAGSSSGFYASSSSTSASALASPTLSMGGSKVEGGITSSAIYLHADVSGYSSVLIFSFAIVLLSVCQ